MRYLVPPTETLLGAGEDSVVSVEVLQGLRDVADGVSRSHELQLGGWFWLYPMVVVCVVIREAK